MDQSALRSLSRERSEGYSHGKTKRKSSPSRARAEGSCTGNSPFHELQERGTRRVCGKGTSTQPSGVSSRRKTEKARAAAASARNDSDFHSNKLAASFSVSASRGSRHRIHSRLAPELMAGEDR